MSDVEDNINHLLKGQGASFFPTGLKCGSIKLAANEVQAALIFRQIARCQTDTYRFEQCFRCTKQPDRPLQLTSSSHRSRQTNNVGDNQMPVVIEPQGFNESLPEKQLCALDVSAMHRNVA